MRLFYREFHVDAGLATYVIDAYLFQEDKYAPPEISSTFTRSFDSVIVFQVEDMFLLVLSDLVKCCEFDPWKRHEFPYKLKGGESE